MKITFNQLIYSLLLSSTTSQSLRGTEQVRDLAESSLSSSPNLIPHTGDCAVGQGYDIVAGCRATAIDPTSMQTQLSPISGGSSVYTRTLKSSSEVSDMMSSVSSAEGSYSPATYSVKASTTVDYMTSSQVSTMAVTFYIGETQVMKKDYITNVNSMKLSDAALDVFKNNPHHFLDVYGNHFISYINYGATFAGSLSLWETASANSDSLHVFANMEANSVFFDAKASGDFTQKHNSTKSTLSSQASATYSGMGGNILQYDVSNPLGLGDAYTSWAKNVTIDGAAPITMLYADYSEIPQVANYIASLSGTEYETYKELFSSPKISSRTATDINKEAVQTSNLVTALKQAQNYNCYTSGHSDGFSRELRQQLAEASDHMSKIENGMDEAAIIEIQSEGIHSPFYQAEAMQKKYANLISKFPECAPICPGNTLWTQPAGSPNCGAQPANHFQCTGIHQPFHGIAFSHSCDHDSNWEEQVSVECFDTSPLQANIFSGKTETTSMKLNASCEPGYTTQTCPKGYYVTGVNFWHACGEDMNFQREYQLECAEINTSVGYELANSFTSTWQSKASCTDENVFECPVGTVLVGLDFRHPCNHNKSWEEEFRVHCAEVSGYDFYCPA